MKRPKERFVLCLIDCAPGGRDTLGARRELTILMKKHHGHQIHGAIFECASCEVKWMWTNYDQYLEPETATCPTCRGRRVIITSARVLR